MKQICCGDCEERIVRHCRVGAGEETTHRGMDHPGRLQAANVLVERKCEEASFRIRFQRLTGSNGHYDLAPDKARLVRINFGSYRKKLLFGHFLSDVEDCLQSSPIVGAIPRMPQQSLDIEKLE